MEGGILHRYAYYAKQQYIYALLIKWFSERRGRDAPTAWFRRSYTLLFISHKLDLVCFSSYEHVIRMVCTVRSWLLSWINSEGNWLRRLNGRVDDWLAMSFGEKIAANCKPRRGPGLWLAEDMVIVGCSWSLFRFFKADLESDMAEEVKIISHLLLDYLLSTSSFQVGSVVHPNDLIAYRCSNVAV